MIGYPEVGFAVTNEPLKVINGKVNMIRIWLRIPGVAVGTRIEAGENTFAATEV